MDSQLAAQLKCPVCKEIPHGKIFHCKNKHTICLTCLSANQSCPNPNCNVSLAGEENQIRHTVLEAFLDTMDFPCPNKSLGCSVELKRGDTLAHLRKCPQGGTKSFLCQHIGFESCRFECNSRQVPSILQHFQKDHGAEIIEGSTAKLQYSDFGSTLDALITCRRIGPPLIIKRVGHEVTTSFLILPICPFTTKDLKFCSWAWMCILLGELSPDGKQFSMACTVQTSTPKGMPVKWTTGICCLENFEPFLKNPPTLMPWSLLKENYCEGDKLTVEIKIQQDSVGPVKGKQLPTEISKSPLVTMIMPRVKSNLDDVTFAALCVNNLSISSARQNIPPNQQPITNEKLLDVLGKWGKLNNASYIEILTKYVKHSCGFKPDAVKVHEILVRNEATSKYAYNIIIYNSMLLWYNTTQASIQQLKKSDSGIICLYDRVAAALSSKPGDIKNPHRQIILLCYVYLGKIYESDKGFRSWEKIHFPAGFNSVKGKGNLIPKPGYAQSIDHVTIPNGVTSIAEENMALEYNEYFVKTDTGVDNLNAWYAVDFEIVP